MKRFFLITLFVIAGLTTESWAGRTEFPINDGWRFIREDVKGAENHRYNDSSWESISIPHTYNRDDVFDGPDMYRGIGWYRKNLTVDSKYSTKKVFIRFEAASLVADVWMNGKYAGKHMGGYTGFMFDITEYLNFGGENLLAVKINNSNNRDLPPFNYTDFQPFPVSADYAIYGGIYRDVYILVTDKVRIDNVFVFTPSVSEERAVVSVKTTVMNHYSRDKECTLTTKIIDSEGNIAKTIKTTYNIPSGFYTFEQESSPINNPVLWSTDTPYLYTVKSSLSVSGRPLDSVENPLGIRWFEWKEFDNLKLNGKEIFIRGINRHQDIKGYGYAVPNELHVRDLEMIKDTGFNLVRLAHYPQDPVVLDTCDRLGLLVWEEIPVTNCISSTPAYMDNAKSQMREMIQQHRNHPCVLLWSLGNESDQKLDEGSSEEYTNRFFRELNKVAHEEDPTRKTISCNQHIKSNSEIPDVYAPQYWMGWYGSFMEEYGVVLDERHRWDPYFITGEYGAASSLDRHTKRPIPGDWSQEYQCLIHESYVKQAEARSDWYLGHCLWVAFDFASPRLDRGTNPIPYMNQKGIWTFDRKPKDVYYFYKSYYTDGEKDPMVYIVSHSWTERWKKPAKKKIWVYSNCDEVELFNGSVSLGVRKRKPGQTRFEWKKAKVCYNILYTEAKINGIVVATDRIFLDNLPAQDAGEEAVKKTKTKKIKDKSREQTGSSPVTQIQIECDPKSIPADGASKSIITVVLKDSRGLVIRDSDEQVTFVVKGKGVLVGSNPVKPKNGIARITLKAPTTSLVPRGKVTASVSSGVFGAVEVFIRHVQ